MGKKDPAQTTTTTLVDPTTKARQDQLWQQAQAAAGTPYQPYTGEAVAGTNQDMTDSYAAARQAATTGQSQIAQGNDTYGDLAGFNASQVTPGLLDAATAQGAAPITSQQINPLQFGANVPGVSAGGVSATGASAGPAAVAQNVTSKNNSDYDVSKYMNPFIGNVIDTNNTAAQKSLQQAIQSGQAAASAAGAYGGSRHGVADGVATANTLQNLAAQNAGLLNTGFDTAQGLITGDANRDLSAGQGNQSANLQASIANTNAGTQANIANANNGTSAGIASMQGMLDASKANASNALQGQGLSLTAQQANAANALAAGTTNANLFQNMGQFNAQQQQNAGQFNVGNNLAAQEANQQAGIAGANVRGNAASGLIAGGTAAQAAAGKGSDLLNRIGLQQQAQQQNQDNFNYSQFQQQQAYPQQQLSWLNGFTGTPGTTSTQTQTGGGGSPLGQIAGAAATVLPFLL